VKIFLDTANMKEIATAVELGILDGVTTNPTLVSREKGDFWENMRTIARMVPGPVNAEVVAIDAETMVREGHKLREIADNIVVKIPMSAEGLKAVHRLHQERIPTNVTLIFSPNQALLAAKAGATYTSPFLGRLDDISHVGMDLVRDIVAIYDNYGFETEVLAASLRNPIHVIDAALAGAHISTLPFKVLEQMIQHPLTDIGTARFLEDFKKTGVKILG
jgi:transaldolase